MKISAVNESMSRAVCEHCLPRLPDVICRSESALTAFGQTALCGQSSGDANRLFGAVFQPLPP